MKQHLQYVEPTRSVAGDLSSGNGRPARVNKLTPSWISALLGVPLFNFEERQKMRQLLSIDTNPKTIKARPHVGN